MFNNLKTIFLIGAVCALPLSVLAQPENLVLNSSFEEPVDGVTCHSSFNWNFLAKHWYQLFTGNIHNPGVLSNCDGINPSGSYSVPSNSFGYQFASTGDSYGFSLIYYLQYQNHSIYLTDDTTRFMEPFTGTFSQPLSAGRHYLEFYVSRCDEAPNNLIATDVFDMVLHYDTTKYLHPFEPWFPNNDIAWSNPSGNIIRDTMNWVKLSGCFEAKGGERYFSIGAFRDPSLYQHEDLDIYPGNPNLAAYYFDDFYIRECDTCCLDTNPVEDYIQLNGNPVVSGESPVFEVFLNPGHTADIKVFDAAGRIVYESKIQSSGQHQMPYGLATGVYVYAIINNEDDIYSGKVVVN